jgi:hypothetical protein
MSMSAASTGPFRAGAVPAARLSSDERLGEIAEILAMGLQRLLERKSSEKSADFGEKLLDIPAKQSGHPEGLASEDAG